MTVTGLSTPRGVREVPRGVRSSVTAGNGRDNDASVTTSTRALA